MMETHLDPLKRARATMVGCGRLEMCSIIMSNKVAERGSSAANELVQVITGWRMLKLK